MKLGAILVISVITLMIVPAYGDVTSLETDKSVYSIDDKIIFLGTSNNPGEMVHVTIKNPFGNTVEFRSGLVNSTGHFSLVPITADNKIFDKPGTFEATAFGNTQQVQNGTRLSLYFSNDKITVLGLFELKLSTIANKNVDEEKTLSFTVTLTDSTIEDVQFSLANNPPGTTINPTTGQFTWTPNDGQGGITYTFDVVAKAGSLENRQTITINVIDVPPPAPTPEPQPTPEPTPEPKETGIASFVDPKQDPQYYINRYINEETYKDWFDKNYPNITIYEAVGLENPEPSKELAPFVDPKQDPQYYINRYNNEETYKDWFDKNYPDITIYEAVGLENPEPSKELAPFVDPKQDPQYYINRYINEETYKDWFDKNYPDITIYEAVGVEEPEFGECGVGTKLIDGVCEVETSSGGGGCLIATAAYGSEMAPQVQLLREIRDNKVLSTESGHSFMTGFNTFYYSFSPTIADWERESPAFKETVKLGLTPLLTSLSILNHVDIDSEQEMLGYGIGIILMNIGMYFVAPAIVISRIRKSANVISLNFNA